MSASAAIASRSNRRRARAAAVAPAREIAAECCRSPGCWSTCPLAHLDRPFDYLVPDRDGRCGAARRPGPGAVRRAAGRRLRARAARRVRASGPARLHRAGGLRRSGADARGRRAGPGGRRPVRGIDGRRAAAGRAAAARQDRGEVGRQRPAGGPSTGAAARRAADDRHDSARGDAPDCLRRRARIGPAGALPGGAAFLAAIRESRAGPRGLAGAARGRTGRPGWPRRLQSPRDAGRGALLVVPDARDLARLDAALAPRPGRRPTRHPVAPISARPSGTAGSWRSAAARSGWWPAPGRRCSPRWPTSGWWRSSTTATTCSPSRARPTRTPARC